MYGHDSRNRSTTCLKGIRQMTTRNQMAGAQETAADQSVCAPSGPSQIVLVLQGGGALGAYQGGVYQALHEADIEPDWIIGTSIGAINAGIIAGNNVDDRLPRLQEFWRRVQRKRTLGAPFLWPELHETISGWTTLTDGVPGLCRLNPLALLGAHFPLGTEHAGFYSVSPLEASSPLKLGPRRRIPRLEFLGTTGA